MSNTPTRKEKRNLVREMIEEWAENHGTAVKVMITAAFLSVVAFPIAFPDMAFYTMGIVAIAATVGIITKILWVAASEIYDGWYYRKGPRY